MNKLQRAIREDQLSTIDEFLRTIAPSDNEIISIMSDILSRKVLKLLILDLWNVYFLQFSPNPEGKLDENDPKFAQLKLIFHDFKPDFDAGLTIKEVITLMISGKIDGKTDLEPPVNLFPAGFWQLPVVAETLTRRTAETLGVLMPAICANVFELPEDWQAEEHPEGLFIGLEDQTMKLMEEVFPTAPAVCKEMFAQTVKEVPEESDSEETADGGAETADESGKDTPEEGESKG